MEFKIGDEYVSSLGRLIKILDFCNVSYYKYSMIDKYMFEENGKKLTKAAVVSKKKNGDIEYTIELCLLQGWIKINDLNRNHIMKLLLEGRAAGEPIIEISEPEPIQEYFPFYF